MDEKLTIEERKKMEEKINKAICKCGHSRGSHSKFINGLFIGCQDPKCDCKKFEWEESK